MVEGEGAKYLPIDVAKLVFATSVFRYDSNVKCSACRYSTTNSRHDNDRYGVERYVGSRLRYEHEALIQAEEVTFVGFDTTLYPRLLMMAAEVFGWSDDLLSSQTTEDLGNNRVLRLLVPRIQFALVLAL